MRTLAARFGVLLALPLATALGASEARPGSASSLAAPPLVTPRLGLGARVFPVYGDSRVADTFGAARGDVSGDWHHGVDLFAPPGTPVLACADATVFSVGWNRVGGWRLWLVDRQGNEFYYAHLAGYSAFAVDGALVHAGDVLGLVGASGDAEGTPPHLHFEVHPAALLSLGYDGAVDPSGYLRSWRRVRSIPPRARGGWGSRPAAESPAFLLEALDISTAATPSGDSARPLSRRSRSRPGR